VAYAQVTLRLQSFGEYRVLRLLESGQAASIHRVQACDQLLQRLVARAQRIFIADRKNAACIVGAIDQGVIVGYLIKGVGGASKAGQRPAEMSSAPNSESIDNLTQQSSFTRGPTFADAETHLTVSGCGAHPALTVLEPRGTRALV